MAADAARVPDCVAQRLPCRHVLGMRVDHVESQQARDRILAMAAAANVSSQGRYVCAANVHMTMEAHDDGAFRKIVNGADLVVPDGQPMVWALRALGLDQRRRVRVTPDLLIDLLAGAEVCGLRVGLYGGNEETLATFTAFLGDTYPHLRVVYAWNPPFKPLSVKEDQDVATAIRESGTQLLLVGIGCPKQERWMAAHATDSADVSQRRLSCTMLGVGAAFDMFGGRTRNAPRWMQGAGLEWLFRLASEPRRLWRRQLRANPRFVALSLLQLLANRRRR